MKDADLVGGFAKGLRVIEAFGENNPRLSIADVSRLTAMDRATTRRCLLTLTALGYADYDGKFFSLTPRILRLGHSYLSATPLPKIIQPYLDQLCETVGQSASASVLDGTDIVYIARASQRRVMSISLMAGSRLPAYCASMGRVLLAALPEQEALERLHHSELRAWTRYTKVDPNQLSDELKRVREQGFAVIDQELELGLCSIAVPLINARNATVAAINIGAPAAQITASDLPVHFLEPLQDVAASLRPMLG